jgi:hypothetical protein
VFAFGAKIQGVGFHDFREPGTGESGDQIGDPDHRVVSLAALRQDQSHIVSREVLPLFARVRLGRIEQLSRGVASDLAVVGCPTEHGADQRLARLVLASERERADLR